LSLFFDLELDLDPLEPELDFEPDFDDFLEEVLIMG
jgi:hypothetical protein